MGKIRKILYYGSIILPIIDVFVGFCKGVVKAIKETDYSEEYQNMLDERIQQKINERIKENVEKFRKEQL